MEVHPAPGSSAEIDRIHRADQMETLPVGIVLPFPTTGAKAPFGVVSAPMTSATSQTRQGSGRGHFEAPASRWRTPVAGAHGYPFQPASGERQA